MKEKPLLGIGLILVSGIIFATIIRGQMAVLEENSLQFRAEQIELAALEQRLEDVRQISENGAGALGTQVESFYLALPRFEQIPEVLVMLEQIANNSGVSYSVFSVGTPSANEVPVTVAFSGSESTVANYLDNLFFNIRPIVVRSQTVTAAAGTLNVNLNLGVLYQGGER